MTTTILSELAEARSVLDAFMADLANVQAIADAAQLMADALQGGR